MRIPALLLVILCGCGSGPAVLSPRQPWAAELQTAFGRDVELLGGSLPDSAEGFAAANALPGAIVVVDGWRAPSIALSQAQKLGLRDFVQRGGRLLLLGYAARLVYDLGIETRPPDVCEPFRWGFDAQTAEGRSVLGFVLVSGRVPELVERMQHADDGDHVYRFTGGAPVLLPQCLWSAYAPQSGEVLGRLSVLRDGAVEVSPAAALVRWQVGRGAVLACGLMPEVNNQDAVLAANAATFLGNASRWLGDGKPPATVALWRLPGAEAASEPAPMLPLGKRELPAAPLLAHWGWQAAAITEHDGDEPSLPAEILDDVLLSSWRAGADVLALDVSDRERGLPLAWSAKDPLRRPDGYRGSTFWPDWGPSALGMLAREAHARSMQVQLLLPGPPVQDGAVAAQLAALRFLGRELFDRRARGVEALDGLTLQHWFGDANGYAAAMLQDFQPGGFVQGLGGNERLAGGVPVVDAGDGRPAGFVASGISQQWRGGGFPADLYPNGRLDCRARPAPSQWGSVGSGFGSGVDSGIDSGGGSGGDWIVTQCNDFARARLGNGASLWWRAYNPATMAADTRAYVEGISQEPVRGAVAARCSSTGLGGWRDAERQLQPRMQPGFGSEIAVPASTHLLQNNYIRLHGSGGGFWFDPAGLARFRDGEAVLLGKELFRTRLFGGRPSGDETRAVDLDLYAIGARGAGGYGSELRVDAGGGVQLPAVLACARAPQWPQLLRCDLDVPTGYYELELRLFAADGDSVLGIGLDGSDLQCVPVLQRSAASESVVALHLARAGPRTLVLECRRGGSIAIQRLRLCRTADMAAEASVAMPAGAMASLQELTASSYFGERATLTTLADLPGLLWRTECTRAVRNLQLERHFALLHHRRLQRSSAGEPADRLRAPFVLGSDDPAIPDLAVVPLQLSRYEHFELRSDGLVLVGAPEPLAVTKVGFLLLLNGEAEALARLTTVFAAIDQPDVLDLAGGEATLRSDLPFAWTRVVELHQQGRTPYLVREHGWWTWRGATPAPDGGDLLRLVHLPGDSVQIVGGPALLTRTRPGPGSLHRVALQEPLPASVTVRVLQPDALMTPCVTMAADFDEAFVDGKPWSYRDGRTIYLPARLDTFRIETRSHGGGASPHLVATRGCIDSCNFDPSRHQLEFLCRPVAGWPPGLPFVAFVAGPEPKAIDGGERIAESELRQGDAALAAAALQRGVLIRFRAGLVRVQYGD